MIADVGKGIVFEMNGGEEVGRGGVAGTCVALTRANHLHTRRPH